MRRASMRGEKKPIWSLQSQSGNASESDGTVTWNLVRSNCTFQSAPKAPALSRRRSYWPSATCLVPPTIIQGINRARPCRVAGSSRVPTL